MGEPAEEVAREPARPLGELLIVLPPFEDGEDKGPACGFHIALQFLSESFERADQVELLDHAGNESGSR